MKRPAEIATSGVVSTNVDSSTSLVALEIPDEIDEESALGLIVANRRHGVGVAVGAGVPAGLGIMLLYAANKGLLAVSWQALAATFLLGLLVVPIAFISSRQAFLTECATRNLSTILRMGAAEFSEQFLPCS